MGSLTRCPSISLLPLQKLEEELRLHKCSTRECIEQYYLDKLKQVCGPGVGMGLCFRASEPLNWAYQPMGLFVEVSGTEPVWAPEHPLPLRGS